MFKMTFLDQLDWSAIRTMIRFIFKETDINIYVYSLTELKHAEKQKNHRRTSFQPTRRTPWYKPNLKTYSKRIDHKTEQQLEAVNNVYNITMFPDHQGLYFEHHGSAKVSHINWDLVAFIDLTTSGSQYSMIRSQYEATVEVCEWMTERFGSVEISSTYEQFVQLFRRATLPYLYEI